MTKSTKRTNTTRLNSIQRTPIPELKSKVYVLDTNVLIHDPNSVINFDEHQVAIPITVLEELDKLKSSKHTVAADCRQAIRRIDELIGDAPPDKVERGVPIIRPDTIQAKGSISILMSDPDSKVTPLNPALPNDLNDNKIINQIVKLQSSSPHIEYVLVTKDINMRLKARGCGIRSEDYQNDQLVSDIDLLPAGFIQLEGSFWDNIDHVESVLEGKRAKHIISKSSLDFDVYYNQFIVDEQGFIGKVVEIGSDHIALKDMCHDLMMSQEAWGLHPRDIHQAMALNILLDPDIHLVTLTGSAGSGKTILALAAAIEQTISIKRYKRIIVTRTIQGLDEDIGFLPGTEEEKMEPWLGAITDNLEALHDDDECRDGSLDYLLQKVPLQFKSLNYMRGRSFQQSFILIDECQNLTPHQIKTIITRAGAGSKVVCLGNLAQIDTAYMNPISSGLTYLTARFRQFPLGGTLQLQGVPRSQLAEYAEQYL
ncbi:PhoH family protein [Litoribrevibacter euphylliae]|uniref:PhoH family protein n=1 Tax=Litoribrevibacter euphylliae TaxID=1834034 RepID=A0ABV7HIP3_9GAMM